MAKIEMDISEYEVMKENKKLLEASLENERNLQEQIKILSDEKTKALEEAKMRVVKITKTEITEHLLRKKTDDENIFRELLYLTGVDYRGVSLKPDYIHTDHLQNIFFEKVTSYSTPVNETTTHGLDEIKHEIREDLKKNIDDEIKTKIGQAEALISRNGELIKENKNLVYSNENFSDKNKALVENMDKLNENIIDGQNNLKAFNNVKLILKNGYGLFGKAKLLDKLIKTITLK